MECRKDLQGVEVSFISPDADPGLANILHWRLSGIDGVPASNLTLDEVIDKLSQWGRPLSLSFVSGPSEHDIEDMNRSIFQAQRAALSTPPDSPERAKLQAQAAELKTEQSRLMLKFKQDKRKEAQAARAAADAAAAAKVAADAKFAAEMAAQARYENAPDEWRRSYKELDLRETGQVTQADLAVSYGAGSEEVFEKAKCEEGYIRGIRTSNPDP